MSDLHYGFRISTTTTFTIPSITTRGRTWPLQTNSSLCVRNKAEKIKRRKFIFALIYTIRSCVEILEWKHVLWVQRLSLYKSGWLFIVIVDKTLACKEYNHDCSHANRWLFLKFSAFAPDYHSFKSKKLMCFAQNVIDRAFDSTLLFSFSLLHLSLGQCWLSSVSKVFSLHSWVPGI